MRGAMACRRRIERALPAGRGRFVRALALGDTRGLDDADWEILRATGLTHLIAISGFHVGLVAGFGALLMSAFYRLFPALARRLPRTAGPGAVGLAVRRGVHRAGGLRIADRAHLADDRGGVAGATAAPPAIGRRRAARLRRIAVLLVDPLSVLAPGFWLSFVGVAWLLWCLPQDQNAGLVAPFLRAQGVAMLGLLPLTRLVLRPGVAARTVGQPGRHSV